MLFAARVDVEGRTIICVMLTTGAHPRDSLSPVLLFASRRDNLRRSNPACLIVVDQEIVSFPAHIAPDAKIISIHILSFLVPPVVRLTEQMANVFPQHSYFEMVLA